MKSREGARGEGNGGDLGGWGGAVEMPNGEGGKIAQGGRGKKKEEEGGRRRKKKRGGRAGWAAKLP